MKNRGQMASWLAAKQEAQDNQISMTYFEHERDPRLRFSYGGEKLARLPVDAVAVHAILERYFPNAAVATADDWKIIVRLVP